LSQRLFPNQLPQHLKQGLAPCYLLFGDEPLQRIESLQLLQQTAQRNGFTETTRLTLDDVDITPLVDALQGMSLFSSQQVVILDAGKGKLGKSVAELLQHYAAAPSPDILLLLHGDKLEAAQKNKAWFKALQKLANEVIISQPTGNQLYRWLNDRSRGLGLKLEQEACQLLVDSHEGNLLALSQELEKLQLIYQQQPISAQQVKEVAVDQSRYSVFQLADALLCGDITTTLHMLEQLQQEGIEPLVVAWALNRELSTLQQLMQPEAQGNQAQLFKTLRIWSSRQALYKQAQARLSSGQINYCLILLADIEQRLKGAEQHSISPWPLFQTLGMLLCGQPLPVAWLQGQPESAI